VKITYLNNEAVAYIAQVTYSMLSDPSGPDLRGSQMDNFTTMMKNLVRKYNLHNRQGYGARILDKDLEDVARNVHTLPVPEYRNAKFTDMAITDGVHTSRTHGFWRPTVEPFILNRVHFVDPDVEETTMAVRGVSHENSVTSDDEIGALIRKYRTVGGPDKSAVVRRLTYLFLTITQKDADTLSSRLSARRTSDHLSTLFHDVMPATEKANLLAALNQPGR
jgi:hypothetical protein